jgi:nucleotide-binding universal stress UspA family protein
LTQAREYLEGQGVKAEYQSAVGNPADTIAQLAQERDADLIVVGTHQPNVLQRLLGQSVSESVSHKAHCDVLVVH